MPLRQSVPIIIRTFAIAAIIGLAAHRVWAQEDESAHAPVRSPAGASERAAQGSAPLPKPSRSASTPTPVGSMEWLRQRLGDKLGATPDPESREALRIVNRAPKKPLPDARGGASSASGARSGERAESSANASTTRNTGSAAARVEGSSTAGSVRSAEGASPPRVSASASARATRLAAAAASAEPLAASPKAVQWDYHGAYAPHRWARLDPLYSACGNGKRQSPIDIRDSIKVALDPVFFDYKPSAFSVLDEGHFIQVNMASGNSIGIMGRVYELVEFHIHRPAEEVVNGRRYDMSVHMTHRDAEGRLAVVSVLLDRGGPQPVVQTVWNNLPLDKHEAVPAQVQLDLNELLPADKGYFTYLGSLTHPPCTEGVLWIVLKQPVQVSDEQIDIYSRLYPMNARPLQPVAGRLIKQSN